MDKILTFIGNNGYFVNENQELVLYDDLNYLMDNYSFEYFYNKIIKIERKKKIKLFNIVKNKIVANDFSCVIKFKKLTIQIFSEDIMAANPSSSSG